VIVGPRRALDLSRCAGWYLIVFYLTYGLRPLATELTGDNTLYQVLQIDPMEQHWALLAVAVSMSICFFALGYRIAVPGEARPAGKGSPANGGIIGAEAAYKVMVFLMILGYATLLIASLSGGAAGEQADIAGANAGVYEHNTAYLMQADLFVSTAATLYYILTDRLGMSLLLALPWVGSRVLYGWGRNVLIGHFFALMSVFFLKRRLHNSGAVKRSQALIIGLGVLIVLCLFPFLGMVRSLKKGLNLNASSFSGDVVRMAASNSDPVDMMQTYIGTNSAISGFEPTLYHLLHDRQPGWGVSYLYYYVFLPIPRVIFPDKGTSYIWEQRLLGIDWDPRVTLIGMAPGAVGGAYEEWGWIGIPAEFLFTGWLIGWAEERARRKPNAAYVQVGYAGLYSMVPLLGRSTLLGLIPMKWSFAYGIPVLILWFVHKNALEEVRLARSRAKAAQARVSARLPPQRA
jgi:hypothetical protein